MIGLAGPQESGPAVSDRAISDFPRLLRLGGRGSGASGRRALGERKPAARGLQWGVALVRQPC